MENDGLSSKQVGSQASRRVTRRLAWIQPVCVSIIVVPALKGLRTNTPLLMIMTISKAKLLFISYKFVKGFLGTTLSLLLISSWNSHDVCQRILYNQKQNFSWIRQKMRNLPVSPIIKFAHFWNVMSIDMTLQKCMIFIMGVYGEILCLSSDQAEILFLVIYKKLTHIVKVSARNNK